METLSYCQLMERMLAAEARVAELEKYKAAFITWQDKTEDWLQRHDVYHNMLQMRPHYDNRKDIIIKEEFLRNVVGLENVVAAWDDSPEVIRHFRSLGITTYAVCDYGDTTQRSDLKSHGVEVLK